MARPAGPAFLLRAAVNTEIPAMTMPPRFDTEPVSAYLSGRAEPPAAAAALQGGAQADVVVIGAGFTGLSAALHLAGAGVRVRVLESRHVGWGGSGRAWGQVAAFAKFMPGRVERDFGPEAGARINAAAAGGPDLVFGLVEQYGMRCDEVRTGNLIAAHTPGKARELAGLATDLQRRGLPVQLLEGAQVRRATGSPRYDVALFDPRGGALNPLGFARGLARAAVARGAVIHEDSPVQRIDKRAAGGWRVASPGGWVDASAVVMATNAFTGRPLAPRVGRTVMPVRAYQLVSQPLEEDVVRSILPGGQPLNDTRRLFSGVRLWPDGRLQVGVDGPLFAAGGQPFEASASRRLRMMFPQLGPLEWTFGWSGWVDMSGDEYPHLHELDTGFWAALGFSGRGIAIGTIMGRDLAILAGSGDRREVVHPVTAVKPLWYHGGYRPLAGLLASGYRAQDRWNDWRHGKAMA